MQQTCIIHRVTFLLFLLLWGMGEGHISAATFARSEDSLLSIIRDTPDTVPDTVYVKDTVYLPSPVAPVRADAVPYTEGRKLLFALRTNALAIPLANVGIEVPIGQRFSLGMDYYYPWIWRPHHSEGVDYSGTANELLALDLEARYWFPGKHSSPGERLLGHSLGVYAAVGYYDFERNASGHQGEFYNVGIDYLFAVALWGGRLHLEFELGLGYIHSVAQPYDNFKGGDKCFRRQGVRENVNWLGPTRAQVSLVLPIYSRKKGGAK